MRHDNYNTVLKAAIKPRANKRYDRVKVHKENTRHEKPRLSIILLDWSCRERFDTLHWLNVQNWPRDDIELIWIELYDRVLDQAMAFADVVITCGQQGIYHKHVGYNIGLLHARGDLICVCDSDAVFPSDFAKSIFDYFYPEASEGPVEDKPGPINGILMHYEGRMSIKYSRNLRFADQLKEPQWNFWGLHPNVGACMTVPRDLAIRFGGFDEHKSYNHPSCDQNCLDRQYQNS